MRDIENNRSRSKDRASDLRSTGDSRGIAGVPRPKQREQPSLGDPENAPGKPSRRTRRADEDAGEP